MSLRFWVLLCVIAGAAACATSSARTSAAVPLQIPEPPPRDAIPPVAVAEKPEPEPAATPAPSAPSTPTTAENGNRRRPPVAAAPAPVVTPPPPTAPAPAAPAPSSPATELRPAGPSTPSVSAQQVRDILNRTTQKLGAIDRRRLSAGRQNDYDAAKRFLAQADTAVKANDLMLAQSSAEKAEALADGLR